MRHILSHTNASRHSSHSAHLGFHSCWALANEANRSVKYRTHIAYSLNTEFNTQLRSRAKSGRVVAKQSLFRFLRSCCSCYSVGSCCSCRSRLFFPPLFDHGCGSSCAGSGDPFFQIWKLSPVSFLLLSEGRGVPRFVNEPREIRLLNTQVNG